MSKGKSAVFTLTNTTDDFLVVFGVKFEASELTLREAEELRLAYETPEVKNNVVEQGTLVYKLLEARVQEDEEMFDLEFFLDNMKISDIARLTNYFYTGEVNRKK